MSLFDLGRYAGKAGKKAAEMGRFFASEWLREPGAQKMLIGKAEPFLRKGIDQLSTAIRPKKAYKTNRKDLDGAGVNFSNLALWVKLRSLDQTNRKRSRCAQSNWKTSKTKRWFHASRA